MSTLQGHSEMAIDASPARVWEVLADASLLPDWAPVVDRTTEHADREEAGAVRRCEVTLGGRSGTIVERCVEAVPQRRLRHAVVEDSFGFTRMLRDYSFTLELRPRGDGATLVTCASFYEPRTLLARALNAALLRRRFASVRGELLGGLRAFVEGRGPADAAVTADAGAPAR